MSFSLFKAAAMDYRTDHQRRRMMLLLLLPACLWLASPAPAFGQTDYNQLTALRDIQSRLGGPLTAMWGNSDPCGSPPWQGIKCNMGASPLTVTELSLRNGGLNGALPESIFTISTLTLLDLGYNSGLTGSIPTSLARLNQLKKLTLQSCSISGPLPTGLGELLDLAYFSVRENDMMGSLPVGLTNLAKMSWLDITNNNFTGPLLDGITTFTNLQHLHLSGNGLESMPANISAVTSLKHLLIDNNLVRQPLPQGLMWMPNLEIVQLSNNSFVVTDSDLLAGNSSTLMEFVAANALVLPQPLELPNYSNFNLSKLQILDLSGARNLGGALPDSIAALQSLFTLELANNNFGPSLPLALTSMINLEELNLDNNRFEGRIPVLTTLTRLDVFLQNNTNITQVALSNLNPTNDTFTFSIHLFGTEVCRGSALEACKPPNCTVTWNNASVPCLEDTRFKCLQLTQQSGSQGGQFFPDPVAFFERKTCQCASPLRAHVLLPFPAVPSIDADRAGTIKQKTLEMFSARANLNLSPTQVMIPEVVRQCGGAFLMTMDFYPASNGALDQLTIRNTLTSTPSYLDQTLYGLQYVQDFVEPATLPSSGNGLSTWQIVGIVVGVVVGAAIITSLVAFVVYQRASNRARHDPFWSKEDEEELKEMGLQLGITRFELQQLKDATEDFSKDLLLGEGGYGQVYKGVLPEGATDAGSVVAVKRAKMAVLSGGKEYRNEIELLSRVRHRNLVELRGFCRAPGEQLLAYEFMANGTLSEWLHPKDDRPALTWEQRLHMTLGGARGLAYLHFGIQPPIIHRDIKPGNILIDGEMNAKVSDFGLSKTAPEEEMEKGLETAIKGTAGYLDPEYYLTDLLTEKSDVYSYGVVMLEIATGQRVFQASTHIRNRVAKSVKEGGIASVMDETLGGPDRRPPDLQTFETFLRLAMQCCTKRATARPCMRDVEALLADLQRGAGSGSTAQRPTTDARSIITTSDALFEVDEDDDDSNILPPGAFGASSSTERGRSTAVFSEESGAFVGPDGELYENTGDLVSGVVAR